MTDAVVTSAGQGAPDPAACSEASDEGKLYHDLSQDVWYECMFDPRTSSRGWVALPLSDGDEQT